MNSILFSRAKCATTPAARLICFPYAGGAASIYRHWCSRLPNDVEIASIQLPGRETRFHEPLQAHINHLLSVIVPDIEQLIVDAPYALYGHSLGALIAFEVSRHIRRRNLSAPRACIVSGRVAPDLPSTTRLNDLPDQLLIEGLRRFGGTPEEVLTNTDLMSILVPIIRADLAVTENYDYYAEPPLATPIVALGGKDDPVVPLAALQAWAKHTSGTFLIETFEGGHFFNFNASFGGS